MAHKTHSADPFAYIREWNNIRTQKGWWHSFELPGEERIEGVCPLDGLKNRIASFPIPDDLTGKRVLDIGTWDGWFAFEMERRGEQALPGGGAHLLLRRIKTVSKAYLKRPFGLSVERRADSPGYWKD